MQTQNQGPEWNLLYSYTRRQAIEDGVLVDLMQPEFIDLVRDAGFKFPVAMTAEAFADYVELSPQAIKAGNNLKGRLWDVFWMLRAAIQQHRGDPREIIYQFYCITDRIKPRLCTLKAVCGPGDQREPVLTIMHPWQD